MAIMSFNKILKPKICILGTPYRQYIRLNCCRYEIVQSFLRIFVHQLRVYLLCRSADQLWSFSGLSLAQLSKLESIRRFWNGKETQN